CFSSLLVYLFPRVLVSFSYVLFFTPSTLFLSFFVPRIPVCAVPGFLAFSPSRFLVSSFPRYLVTSFPRFLVSSFPRFLVSSFPPLSAAATATCTAPSARRAGWSAAGRCVAPARPRQPFPWLPPARLARLLLNPV